MPAVAFPHPPMQPPGDWTMGLPPTASFGEVTVYAKTSPIVPVYVGKFVRIDQTVVTTSFTWMIQGAAPGAGPAATISTMDCRLLCRFNPANRVYLMAVDELSNLMFSLTVDSGNFQFMHMTNWSPFTPVTETVAVPPAITATTWVWLRLQRPATGNTTLEYSLSHQLAYPTDWAPIGSWFIPAIPIRAGFGDGLPWTVGIQQSGTPNATALLDLRRVSYSFNGSPAVLSTFEVDPVVGSTTVAADTGNDNDYTKHSSLPVTVQTE